MIDFVPAEAERRLDWLALTDAIAAGHDLPRAEIADILLDRGEDSLLSRAALIDGLGSLVKTATIFPGNAARGKPTVNGAVTLFSDVDGTAEALVDFQLVTQWKTAADSLLAARRLAPLGAQNILIVGAGAVARTLRAAYQAAFPDAGFTVWNRSVEGARSLAADCPGTDVAEDLEQAVYQADMVTSATLAREPLIRGEWLRPGQHLDLIGSFRPDMREADDDAIRRSRIFVDSFQTALEGTGELAEPLARGVVAREDIVADFYDLEKFRRDPDDITLFKNGGGAHLDLMTARYILEAWRGRA